VSKNKSKPEPDYSEFIVTAADLIAAENARAESPSEQPAAPVRLVLEGEAGQVAALLRSMAPPKRCRKLTAWQESEIYRRVLNGETKSALADEFNVTRQAVQNLVRRIQDEQSE
jgi:hypothetical protein